MNYKAEYQSYTFTTLHLGQRKKSPYAQLFYVRDGKILLRLGRNELMLQQGDTFYLPFECLSQITALQGATIDTLTLSPRLNSQQQCVYPKISGQVTTSLILPLLETLYSAKNNSSRTLEQQKRLIDVLLDELIYCKPQQINAPIKLTPEIDAQLECREIMRQVKSGKKIHALIQDKPELKTAIEQYTNLLE